ncbi:TetR/AcrR family transcriptional regulator [Streptomyces sp. NPDC006978]|uniref:TetR/AcrR family transcriptional regulator n=1 Tax=Streptomyces sp. NPDC006978 TaxID=3364769 RepID=UPI0036B00C1D
MARARKEPQQATTTRRRGAELEEAILREAAEVLKESGVPALTMDEVARRAGTNKNALYRRWPNRVALGVAAYRRLAGEQTAPPDTGSLRGDVLEMLRRANSTWASPYGEVLRGLIAAAGSTPELLAGLRDPAGGAHEVAWLTLLGRAVSRGEAAPEALHPRVAYAPMALLRNEYVMLGVPTVPDAVLAEIVDEVFLPLVYGRGSHGDTSAIHGPRQS